MKEYAHIFRALEDGKGIIHTANGYAWQEISAREALMAIGNKVPPLYLSVKPATININGFEVLEPMREAPRNGTKYWVGDVRGVETPANGFLWAGDCIDRCLLARGLCHTTKEAAELHAKALLSFTAKQ